MVLSDAQIKQYGAALITPFDAARVYSVGYDLTTEAFSATAHQSAQEFSLAPGQSVFVCSAESISLPADVLAQVVLRNSRIRQGLSLEAPVYQPGHKTKVFFRITNVSPDLISLTAADDLAAVMFHQLSAPVQQPYTGTFQQEFDFRGMADYQTKYRQQLTKMEETADAVKAIEKSIYQNVLSIMAVFVAAFTLINVNVSLAQANNSLQTLLTFNLATAGSIGFLMALVSYIVPPKSGHHHWPMWVASAACFLAAVVVQLLPL